MIAAMETSNRTGAMRAVEFDRYGPAEALRVVDVPTPSPAQGEVLVEVIAASVNPKDTFVRKGRFKRVTGTRFPLRVGYDASGIVVTSTVGGFPTGTRVFGMLNGWAGGAAADRVSWPVRELALAPACLALADAAAVPLAGLTALQALRDVGRLEAGQAVLINGASGGVGSFAIQIAHAWGADVTGVCSPAAAEHVRSLGAREVLDYGERELTGGPYDIVFDVFGNLSAHRVAPLLSRRGTYITTVPNAANFRAAWAFWRRPRTRVVIVRSRRADLELLATMIDAGELRVHVDARYAPEQIVEAHRHVERKHTRGKVLVEFQ